MTTHCSQKVLTVPRKGEFKTLADHMEKVSVDAESGCWLWDGLLLRNGYGQLRSHNKRWLAHRYFYTEIVGEIEDGKVLDHKCHNEAECDLANECPHRRCVNPEHLEPSTSGENVMRGRSFAPRNAEKTHCAKGHEFTEINTRIDKGKWRICRTCKRDQANTPRAKQLKKDWKQKWRAERRLKGLKAA